LATGVGVRDPRTAAPPATDSTDIGVTDLCTADAVDAADAHNVPDVPENTLTGEAAPAVRSGPVAPPSHGSAEAADTLGTGAGVQCAGTGPD